MGEANEASGSRKTHGILLPVFNEAENSTETMDLKLGEAVEASQKSPKDRIWGSSS